VSAARLGEAYTREECALVASVARQSGAALNALRARESINLMRALARGDLGQEQGRIWAKAFAARWTPG